MRKFFLTLCFICLLSSPVFAGVLFGTDDFISTTQNLGSGTKLSTCFWIFPPDNVPAETRNIIIARWDNISDERGFQIRMDATEEFTIAVSSDGSSQDLFMSSAFFFTLDTWQHLCVVYNAGDLVVYLNGVSSLTDTLTQTTLNAATVNLDIGRARNAGTYDFGDMILTDVGLWNTDLTQAEVTLLSQSRVMRLSLQIQPSFLQGYWALDDEPDGTSCDGDTFLDLSGNGNNGTGDDGANNVGLTAVAEEILSYQ